MANLHMSKAPPSLDPKGALPTALPPMSVPKNSIGHVREGGFEEAVVASGKFYCVGGHRNLHSGGTSGRNECLPLQWRRTLNPHLRSFDTPQPPLIPTRMSGGAPGLRQGGSFRSLRPGSSSFATPRLAHRQSEAGFTR